MRVHFVGIGGSGISAVAQIAHHQGFQVSGCDLQADTPYIEKVRKLGIETQTGHDVNHVQNADIVAVTPAVFYQNLEHPELVQAQKTKKLMTWQEFMGKHLHKDKFLICIAGTHGKSTTTALTGVLLEAAKVDPTVEVGATVNAWHNNIRLGKGKYFVSEADEFHNNFFAYHPNILILNNIDMDHPDFFPTKDKLLSSFKDFVLQLKTPSILITNKDSVWVQEMLKIIPTSKMSKIKIIQYSLHDVTNIKFTSKIITFIFQKKIYSIQLPGLHNVANSLGVILLAKELNIPYKRIYQSLKSFTGVGRRSEIVGEKRNIRVMDDYGPHPSAMLATITAFKQRYPTSRIWAIVEPHTYSRNIALLANFESAMKNADFVIISEIFPSREKDPGNFSGADISQACRHPFSRYIPKFEDIATTVKLEAKPKDVIIVFGAGNSYKLSKLILEIL